MAVNQEQLLQDTIEWIEAAGMGQVLGAATEAETRHEAIVATRLNFVRTALAVELLDKYTEAELGIPAGRVALGLLGIAVGEADMELSEAEPDRLISIDDFRIFDEKGTHTTRTWRALHREHDTLVEARHRLQSRNLGPDETREWENVVARLQPFDGLVREELISLRVLKRLANRRQIRIRDIGTGSRKLIDKVAEMEYDPLW